MRALSLDEIEREIMATETEHEKLVKNTAASFNTPDPRLAPGRWLGPRGCADHDLSQEEAQALVAERARVGHVLSFAERKTLLNRIRKIK
jgi:hypothetical protein